MRAFSFFMCLLICFSAYADSLYSIERVENPCFSRQESKQQEMACQICSEVALEKAVEDCREEREAADELFDDVIYAATEDYARVYRQWRERVNRRDQCKVDILKSCLQSRL